jgi:hypothetical protein
MTYLALLFFLSSLIFTAIGYKKANRNIMLIGFLFLLCSLIPDFISGVIDGYNSCINDTNC